MLVDDEETVRSVTGEMLRRFGLNVVTAIDGRQAVELYRRKQADISAVLLDLTMPHMNGEEAFRELRKINPDAGRGFMMEGRGMGHHGMGQGMGYGPGNCRKQYRNRL